MSDQAYSDDDLVYVDPETKSVVGEVELNDEGVPKSLPYQQSTGKKSWRKFYPLGTYRSMKKAFHLEGKKSEKDGDLAIDEALPLLLNDTL